ncbi:3R-linalool synthase [Hibiscus syriacus]|uniref:Ribosome-recycling factor, chloroplastic n=1 Tax=Hibiscus syriacus TaxID=106335 RepID=A0A6A2YWZ7_HIBSY|nr:3R-linalool synthase [Hibiscus syriacus]
MILVGVQWNWLPILGLLKASASSQMDAAIVALSRELAKLRTGRASADGCCNSGLIEGVSQIETGRASAGMLDHIIVETEGVKMQLNHLAVVSVIDSKTLSVNPYDPNTLKALEKAIVTSPLGLNPKVDGERLVAGTGYDKESGFWLVSKDEARLEKESADELCKAKEKEIAQG